MGHYFAPGAKGIFMEPTSVWITGTQVHPKEQPSQEQLPPSYEAEHTLEIKPNAIKRPTGNLIKSPQFQREGEKRATPNIQPKGLFHFHNALNKQRAIADQPTVEFQRLPKTQPAQDSSIEHSKTQHMPVVARIQPHIPLTPSLPHIIARGKLEIIETLKLPRIRPQEGQPINPLTQAIAGQHVQQKSRFTRSMAFLLITLLCMILLQTLPQGSQQIFGSQGWAYTLGGPGAPKTNLLSHVSNQMQTTTTPQQYINTIIQNMTLDQKLGQMMLVQFVGADFSLDLNTMISQYNVGSVLLLTGNHNIVSKGQLTSLTRQIQHNSTLPMIISLDQEGGAVDRLVDLDGPRPSAAQITARGDPTQATMAGKQDAQDLSQYGINLQLAPVVDVGTPYSQLQRDGRTFGQNADTVTRMAGAYLQGLQKSGKVLGTLKHFPGLGSSTVDPHRGLPFLYHTQEQLDQIDWAPYRNLIKRGLVHAIMVTHEVVTAIDNNTPASLSSRIVTGVLRDQMGFQGVIMTDSLTMEGVSAYYSTKQAAVLAVEAGSDIIMGADTPATVATMLQGIREAINTGEIKTQRIDQSVYRILMMKYQMGLLTLPKK
jgi:beta-N-acetylhexosaminidase